MERVRQLLVQEQQLAPAYEPLLEDPAEPGDAEVLTRDLDDVRKSEFSWLVYGVFCLLGVAMLWAW